MSSQETLELLGNPTRLRILRALQSHGGKIELSKLAEILSEGDPTASVKRLTSTLIRVHIPKMEQMGLVQRDANANVLTLKELPAPIATQLESMLLLLFDLLRGENSS